MPSKAVECCNVTLLLIRYMGIGLADGNVNMNRLPGWEKDSYGYHGDDGNSFCSSGNGKKYGPQFTTGDVIGMFNSAMLTVEFLPKGQFLRAPVYWYTCTGTHVHGYPGCKGINFNIHQGAAST